MPWMGLFLRKHVQSVDKLSGSRQPSIPYALSHLGKPYDLVNVPEECPNLSNTCQVQYNKQCLGFGIKSEILKRSWLYEELKESQFLSLLKPKFFQGLNFHLSGLDLHSVSRIFLRYLLALSHHSLKLTPNTRA